MSKEDKKPVNSRFVTVNYRGEDVSVQVNADGEIIGAAAKGPINLYRADLKAAVAKALGQKR